MNVGSRTKIGLKAAVESKTQLENQLRDEKEFDPDFGIVWQNPDIRSPSGGIALLIGTSLR